MKTYTLKLKTALCIIALTVASQAHAVKEAPEGMKPADSTKADTGSTFIEDMCNNIKTDYEAIETLVKEFISKDTPKDFRFGVYCDKCLAKKDQIYKERIEPLKLKLDELTTSQPNSNYHKAVQKTHEIASDIYKRLEKICKILNDHRISKDWNSAPKLIGPLKPELETLVSPATLDLLATKLTELEKLLQNEGATKVAAEIASLKKLVLKIKSESGQLKQNLTQLYSFISMKLKKL